MLFKIKDELLGKYRLIKSLGMGGFGQVYEGLDLSLERPIAIKVIRPDVLSAIDQYHIDSFVTEARAIALLQHQNVLTVHSLDTVPHPNRQNVEIPFLVMELAHGSLTDKLKAGTLSPKQSLFAVQQLCAGLSYAHSEGILHLDIKPANILIDSHGDIKLADFGLAKILRGATSRAAIGTGGTPAYMPPEQAHGGDATFASDIYSLALTIHTLLTGKLAQKWHRYSGAYQSRTLDIDNSLPQLVRDVIAKATEEQISDRYRTVHEFLDAFEKAVNPSTSPSTVTEQTLHLPPDPLPLTTLSDEDAQGLLEAMRELGEYATENASKLNEREIVTYAFKGDGFFNMLGFGEAGQDIALERGNADVILKAAGGRPIAIVEFKRPSVPPQKGLKQLEERYVAQQLPDAGVLCNGKQLIIYRRHLSGLLKPPVVSINLKEATVEDAKRVCRWMGKRSLDFKDIEQFRQAVKVYTASPIYITGSNNAGGTAFVNRFALTVGTAFGRLVEAMADTLPLLIERSNFTKGAYSFWRKIYARNLKYEDAPKSWKAFLQGSSKENLYRFMFALESAYALLSRLMLAKVMQDKGFEYIDIETRLISALEGEMRVGKLPYTAYAKATESLLKHAGKQAFEAIFASDIFDWWFDVDRLKGDPILGERIGEALLSIFTFDFADLNGDLLGELYQSYFDAESRKALGEFYTSPEIVNFILDEVRYVSSPALPTQRILDPACGSGTFLVQALQRYLEATKNQPATTTLKQLLEGLLVIGFDVNPFAVLMAQVNYAAQIIPLYSRALLEPGDHTQLTKLPIPVLRTDSLRQEYREGEATKIEGMRSGESVQLSLQLSVTQNVNVSVIKAELPVEVKKGVYFEAEIPVPRYDIARALHGINNAIEYFRALRVLFDAVGANAKTARELQGYLEDAGFADNAKGLSEFMIDAMTQLVKQMRLLKERYDDGRFLKTLADLALALVLKGDIQYDFIVGNPPYIRTQYIPPLIRKRWEGWYDWASGSFDAYMPFIERGLHAKAVEGLRQEAWLKPNGRMAYIVPNRFLLANYAKTLREEIEKYADIELIVDFRDSRMFRDALNYPAIFVVRRLDENDLLREDSSSFSAVRVFNAPSLKKGVDEVVSPIINEIELHLARVRAGSEFVQGKIADAFVANQDDLTAERWIFMPPHEHEVFKKIESATKTRLEDLTLTGSGAFQGLATGDDPSLVFKLVEDRGDTLIVQPKGNKSWTPPERVEIEKGILRKWLFGKDVERWKINWRGWFVLFPYKLITAMEPDGSGGHIPVEKLRLMPTRETIQTFVQKHKYVNDGAIPLIDEEYPLAWKYLKSVKNRLVAREKNKRVKSHLWYELARPQNLEHFDSAKILLQVSSTEPDYAIDRHGDYVFAAGGTSGVYGILLDETVMLNSTLTALLNSSTLDYYLKHVSTIYSGKSYSYGDQFIRGIPIHTDEPAITKIANALILKAEQTIELKEELEKFPAPQAQSLSSHIELFPFLMLVHGSLKSSTFATKSVKFSDNSDGTIEMKFGRTVLTLPHKPFQAVIERWLSVQSKKVDADLLTNLRLPRESRACQLLVEKFDSVQQATQNLQAATEKDEMNLNQLVAQSYGLTETDVKIVDKFLAQY